MAGLEETLGLDVSPALDALDQLAASATESLGSALSGVVSDFSSQLQEAIGELSTVAEAVPDIVIPVDADTAPADEAIAATVGIAESSAPAITVDADTEPAQAEVASAVAAIDAQDATISVDADTTAAEEAVSGLGDSLALTGERADATTSQMGGTVNQIALLSAASKLGAGELGGLSDAGGAVGGGLGIAAAGAVGLGLGIGVLIDKGLGATSALQRFDLIVGDMGRSVLNVNVGSLNTDLDALAIKLGTDDEALRNASATLFQFGLNNGASRQEAALFTNQIDALAARAVSLKPELGSVADVAESLSVRIARGGRFAEGFQVALTATEIAARALANTGKESAADLSLYEKSVAGAQLAVEKYGSSLDETITQGAENAAIAQRSLREQLENVLEAAGKPLVSPFLDATKAAIPDVKEFASALSAIAQVALPAITIGLQAVEPFIQPLVIGFVAVEVAAKGVAVAEAIMASSLVAGEAGFIANTGAALANVGATSAAAASAGQLAVVAAAGAAAFLITTEVLEFGDRRGLIPFIGHGKDMDKLLGDIKESATEVAKATNSQLVPSFESLVSAAQKADQLGASPLVVRMRAFQEVADQDVDAAFRLRDAIARTGENVAGYDRILNRAIQTQKEQEAAARLAAQQLDQSNVKLGVQAQLARTASDALRAYNLGIGSAGQALKDLSAAQQDENDRLSLFSTQLERLINPQLGFVQANQAFGESVQGVADAYAEEADKSRTAAQVDNDRRNATIASARALIALTEATAAKEIAEGRGATASDVAAQALQNGTQALEDQLVKSGLAKDAADAFLSSLGLFPGKSAEAASGLIGSLGKALSDQLVPALTNAGTLAGEALGAAAKNALLPKSQRFLTDEEARRFVDAYIKPIQEAAEIESPSKLFAREVGLPMAEGVAVGFSQGAGLLAGTASGVVSSGVAAARGAIGTPDFGGVSAPSTLFGLPSQGSTTTLLIDRIEVDVHDVKDPVTAQRVGESFADGFLLAIEKQNIRVAVRNG